MYSKYILLAALMNAITITAEDPYINDPNAMESIIPGPDGPDYFDTRDDDNPLDSRTPEDAQDLSARASQPFCKDDQISNMDVKHCRCKQDLTELCKPRDCSTCGLPDTKDKYTKSCHAGCKNFQFDCGGCGIYFHKLCNCLKDPKNCPTSKGVIAPNTTPQFVYMKTDPAKGHDLITSTDIIPGILSIKDTPKVHDDYWTWAQSQLANPDRQALVLNSYRSHTHEQIHIHVCDHKDTTYDFFSDRADPPGSGGRLVHMDHGKPNDPTDPEMWCLALEKKKPVKYFGSVIKQLLDSKPKGICEGVVGAGIMRDKKDRTWACITTNSKGPLAKFCG